MKKSFILLLIGLGLSASVKEDISNLLSNNPDIKASLNQFLAQKKEIKVAKSEFLPKVDFNLQLGTAKSGNFKSNTVDLSYRYYKAALILTQNIFNGFGSEANLNYQKAKSVSFAFKYINSVNNITDKGLKEYINVLKAKKMYENAKENLRITKSILKKVKELYKGGMTTKSEVTKIESQYYLAKSNVIALKDNLTKAINNFEKIFGYKPDLANMNFDIELKIPYTLKEAINRAMNNNPAIKSAKFNVKALNEYQKVVDKNIYPTVDLQLRQNYNDKSDINPYDSADDRFIASLNLNYNIFNGYKDKTNSQINRIKTNEALNKLEKIKREIKANLLNAWDLKITLKERLSNLKEYKLYSNQTLKLYQKEFNMGRRTLLELLTAQNDLYKAKNEIVKAEYDLLYAKIKILNLTGDLVETIYNKNIFKGLIK